jgi:diguanylate cyclase (GGDEF)-like protein
MPFPASPRTLERVWHASVERLFHLGRPSAWFVCFALLGAYSTIDYFAPPELDVSFICVFVVLLACWNLGTAAGLALAALAVCLQGWLLADLARSLPNGELGYITILANRGLTLGLVVALTVPLKQLYEREQATARVDYLTGAHNRKAFHDLLAVELARAQRSRAPLSVAYLDCDDFKRVNDELGHEQGDALLREAVKIMRSLLRATDVVARLGGDEFAILLPAATRAHATESMARVQARLHEAMRKRGWPVTFSIGVGTLQGPESGAETIVAACDRLMYRAKRAGKGRLVHDAI